KEILTRMGLGAESSQTLLEVGCGTGYNLKRLAQRFHKLNLIGVDVSKDMLDQAGKNLAQFPNKVSLIEKPYAPGSFTPPQQPDIILFSYALTMFNPGWEDAIAKAWEDLPVGGKIAVVDFHDTPAGWFRWWMGQNHVRMEAHLIPLLEQRFKPLFYKARRAYGGVWRYCVFVGEKA
ncbi:MAG: class I SAM-dependent methyltransferase, partial [Bacteroidetes bacterium]|nr:class I SAM-dependent methyltransferase [Bacteroidota bacterium]